MVHWRMVISVILMMMGWYAFEEVSNGETIRRITQVEIIPDNALSRSEFTCLREFALPGEYDAKGIELTKQNLMKTGRFSAVEVLEFADERDDVLTFKLTPQPYVREIYLSGVTQVSKNQLLAATDLRKFTVIAEDTVSKTVNQMHDFYERSGLARPKIRTATEQVYADGGTSVLFTLVETPLPETELFTYQLSGQPGILTRYRLLSSIRYFRWKTRLWGFNVEKAQSYVNKYERRYRRIGYQDADFSFTSDLTDNAPEKVSVHMELDIGKRIKLRMKDVGYFTSRDIIKSWRRRNMPLTELEIERLEKRTRETIQEQGYLEAQVSSTAQETEKQRKVTIKAEKKACYHVQSITFEGNQSLSSADLKKAITIHEPRFWGLSKSSPGPKAISESVKMLTGFYASKGFPLAKIKPSIEAIDDDGKKIVFQISEGPFKSIGKIGFSGVAAFTEQELSTICGLTSGEPFVKDTLKDAATSLQKAYWSKGYSKASISLRYTQSSDESVDVTFSITEGVSYTLGPTIIQGNYKTRASLLLNLEKINRGEPFDFLPFAGLQQEMYELNLFDSIAIRAEEREDRTETAVTVAVQERSTGVIEGGFDLNTKRGLEVTGKIGESNLFGRAISGSVGGLYGLHRSSISTSISQPYLLGYRLFNFAKATYTDDRTNSGFNTSNLGLEAGVVKKISQHTSCSLTYLYEHEVAYDIKPDVTLEFGSGNVASLIPAITFDSRDDIFTPHTGAFFATRFKWSAAPLGAQLTFYRLESDYRWFYTFGTQFTFAAATRIGRIWAVEGSDDVPLNERFFIGGANTNRGFGEKELGPKGANGSPIGGESYIESNIELRFPLYRNLEAGVFVDAGNSFFTTPISPYLRPAAGFGLRLRTPFGPLRADLGFNLDKREIEDAFVFHFAIGHAF